MNELINKQAAIAMSERIVDEIERLNTLDTKEKKIRVKKLMESIVTAEPYHGRLIDADELTKSIDRDYGVLNIYQLPSDIRGVIEKYINKAPTILGATMMYKINNYGFEEDPDMI